MHKQGRAAGRQHGKQGRDKVRAVADAHDHPIARREPLPSELVHEPGSTAVKGVGRYGFKAKRIGVFGSESEFAGNPWESTFSPGIEQSCTAGFAAGAKHGSEKFCVTKNGGLNPGLGFEYGPFSCPP